MMQRNYVKSKKEGGLGK